MEELKVIGISSVSGVYRFLNTLNGKSYIGSTVNMRERWLDHIAELNGNKHVNKYLLAAWKKNGPGAFTFEIIERCDANNLQGREKWWIEHYWKHSEAWFSKRRGRKLTQAHKDAIAKGNTGRVFSEETRRKIGEANRRAWLRKGGQLCLNLA